LKPQPYAVVQGQRLMQEASDIFLGWTKGEVVDLYVRQLRDMNVTAEIATFSNKEFDYTRGCVLRRLRERMVAPETRL
jgi:hypothetical protein